MKPTKVYRLFLIWYLLFLVYFMLVYHRNFDLSWMVKGGLPYLISIYGKTVNLVPFATIMRYTVHLRSGIDLFLVNIVGNVIFFIPMGILRQAFKKLKNIWLYILIVLVIILLLEVLQFVTMSGTFDVDDMLLNMIGALIGYRLFKIRRL